MYKSSTLYPSVPSLCHSPVPRFRTARSSSRINLVVISFSRYEAPKFETLLLYDSVSTQKAHHYLPPSLPALSY